MSEQKTDVVTTEVQPDAPVNATRRKLTTAALAGPVVLGTLASKQALGAVPYKCTVSGQVSNNYSPTGHRDGNCSNLGLSPGCWKQSSGNNKAKWPASGPARNALFSTVFGVNFYGATLIQVLCAQNYGGTNSQNVANPIPNGAPNAGLARAGVASLLNAYYKGAISSHSTYGVTVDEVKNLVKSALNGTDLIANQTGGRITTLDYLTSLYGGTASSPDSGTTAGCPKNKNQVFTANQICG